MRPYLLFSFFLTAISVAGYGQYMPMTNTVQTPYGNVQFTTYMRMGGPYYVRGQANPSSKYKFDIVLKNDSAFSVKTRIDLSEEKKQFIALGKNKDKQLLFPADTKSISRTTSYGQRLTGIPADSCWLFKSYFGTINGYSFLAEPGLLYAIAIQRGNDGPVVPLTKDNLLAMVDSEDQRVTKLIEKGKLTKAIEKYNYNWTLQHQKEK